MSEAGGVHFSMGSSEGGDSQRGRAGRPRSGTKARAKGTGRSPMPPHHLPPSPGLGGGGVGGIPTGWTFGSPASDASASSFFTPPFEARASPARAGPSGFGPSPGVDPSGWEPKSSNVLEEQFASLGLQDAPGDRAGAASPGPSPGFSTGGSAWSSRGADGAAKKGAGEGAAPSPTLPASFRAYKEDQARSTPPSKGEHSTKGPEFVFGASPSTSEPSPAAAFSAFSPTSPSSGGSAFVFGSGGSQPPSTPEAAMGGASGFGAGGGAAFGAGVSTPSTSGMSGTPPDFRVSPFPFPSAATPPAFAFTPGSPGPFPSSGAAPPSPAAPLNFNIGTGGAASPAGRKGKKHSARKPKPSPTKHAPAPNPPPFPSAAPPPTAPSPPSPFPDAPVFNLGTSGSPSRAGLSKKPAGRAPKSAAKPGGSARKGRATPPTAEARRAWPAAGGAGESPGSHTGPGAPWAGGGSVLRETTFSAWNNPSPDAGAAGPGGAADDFGSRARARVREGVAESTAESTAAAEAPARATPPAGSSPDRPYRRAVRPGAPGRQRAPSTGGGTADFAKYPSRAGSAGRGDDVEGELIGDFKPIGRRNTAAAGGGPSLAGEAGTSGDASGGAPGRWESSAFGRARNDLDGAERARASGNDAFARGRYRTAEECYGSAVEACEFAAKFIEGSGGRGAAETSKLRALSLSNRAAARLMLQRPRAALADCIEALAADPNFEKARLRRGTCHLRCGELAEAARQFAEVLSNGATGTLRSEARTSLRQAELSRHDLERVVKALEAAGAGAGAGAAAGGGAGAAGGGQAAPRKRRDGAGEGADETLEGALGTIDKLLLVSPHSAPVKRLRVLALFLQGRYGDAASDAAAGGDDEDEGGGGGGEGEGTEEAVGIALPPLGAAGAGGLWGVVWSARWRKRVEARARFQLGELEKVVEILRAAPDGLDEEEAAMLAKGQEVLSLKTTGNDLFKAGKATDAVAQYTKVIEAASGSPAFDAICFCNRAAAFQKLGAILDAVADCSRAVALAPTYQKAFSRRATLRAELRDHPGAVIDLERMLQFIPRVAESGGSPSAAAGGVARAEVASRLKEARAAAEKKWPLDLYKVLGLPHSCTPADVKKAYRQLALKHHPDKAGQGIMQRAPEAVVAVVREECDSLFKAIGEAYAVLSDQSKRLTYDADEAERAMSSRARGGYGARSGFTPTARRGGASGGGRWGNPFTGPAGEGGYAYRSRPQSGTRTQSSYSSARSYANNNWRDSGRHDTFNADDSDGSDDEDYFHASRRGYGYRY